MARPGHCRATGKRRYRDKRESLTVLYQAQTARCWAAHDGTQTRRNEKRVYECPQCRGWHATSQAA